MKVKCLSCTSISKTRRAPEEIAKLMKLDVKTIKALMNSHHPEEVEEGAAADARRAMRA